MHAYRSHTCSELRASDDGAEVRLSGWIHNKRDHGGVLFIDLRDHYGITQVVMPETAEIAAGVSKLPRETVVRFDGVVRKRPDDMINPEHASGEVEVFAKSFEVLGACEPLPFEVATETKVSEDIRLRHRFLDLRRASLHENILLRSRIIASIRRRMTDLGFNEFQTPILTSSSPEGARDFLVPARLHPGKFYALPQAPQQFKQLLMVSGFDRYFQIAPCFRDEAARADRSPGEFYQLDVEMSFATQEDVFAVLEAMLTGLFSEFSDWKVDGAPFVRLPYAETMLRYGTDKPDLRNPLQIAEATDLFEGHKFTAFAGKTVRVLAVPDTTGRPRSWFDRTVDFGKSLGAAGIAWVKVNDDNTLTGPVAKFFEAETVAALIERSGAKPGSSIFMCADANTSLVERVMAGLRTKMGTDLDLLEKDVFRFCWIVDFPMFELDEDTNKVVFSHNPFSMPQGGKKALLEQDPLTIKAFQYDIVCNGYELSSGAVRNHDPELMYKAFEIAGYDRSVVDEKFPALQNAFRFGPPPHAGIAPGVDRIVMLLAGEQNLREVIAFPMNQRAQDLLMGAPSEVAPEQLVELSVKIAAPKKK